MGNEDAMIFIPIAGNYTLDNPTSFTGKIRWDLIGNISWDETGDNDDYRNKGDYQHH